MKKSCFFAAMFFATLFTLGTASHAFAHPSPGRWNRAEWAHRWHNGHFNRWERGRWARNRWAYRRGYMNPGWWGRGDDNGGRWGYGYNRGYYRGDDDGGWGRGGYLPFYGGDRDGDDD